MNCRKRKLSDSSDASLKRIKRDFGWGGAWKMELLIMVEEECHVNIDLDIAGLIFDHSLSWWEVCVYCQELTDPLFSEYENRIHEEEMIVYRCSDCEEIIRDRTRKALKEFPFNDDEM